MNFVCSIKLPHPSKFASKHKLRSPIHKFYYWATKKAIPLSSLLYTFDAYGVINVPGKRLNICAFWVSEQYYKKLNNLTFEWYRKTERMSRKRARRDLGWFMLAYGPSVLPKEVVHKKNYVYITEKILISAEE